MSGREAGKLAMRLVGGVWGHLVGDAVGVPYEFRSAAEIARGGPIRFGATGTHGQPPGTWSDDGALMLALLDSLLAPGGFDVEDQGRRSVAWWRHGAYTPDPGRRPFDIGGATRSALESIAGGKPAADAGRTDERACGNGSLMRILPIALVAAGRGDAAGDADTTLIDQARRASRVTHGHPRAEVACALYVLVAARLLAGERDRGRALEASHVMLRAHEAIGAGSLAAHEDREPRARVMHPTNDVRWSSGDGFAAALDALDHLMAWPERQGRGRVWDSFWSAWEAFEGADSYEATIQRAIAYGNDTDTTAAIAGGLAGIYWGIDGIPPAWLEGMRGHDVADPLIERLTTLGVPGR